MKYNVYITCGTSILTNVAKDLPETKNVLNNNSNATSDSEINENDKICIDNLYLEQIEKWSKFDEEKSKDASAELKCLLTWMKKREIAQKEVHCILIHTDTYIGENAAMIIESWLKNNSYSVELKRIPKLKVSNIDNFQKGLSNLAKWIFDTVSDSTDYSKTIFNVAGGFKSVSGFMQMLGQVKADETIYIFEGNNSEVLSIPRLFNQWNEIDSIEANLDDYHRLSLELAPKNPEKLNSLWFSDNKLTPWGLIIWESCKKQIYSESFIPVVYEKVKLGQEFEKSISKENDFYNINETLDDLCRYLMSNRKINPRNLKYTQLSNKNHSCTHECRLNGNVDEKRFFCTEESNCIIVQKMGEALHKPKSTT